MIDILVPAYTSRPRQNRRFGTHLVTTEVAGLAIALKRPPVRMSLEFHRLNGECLDAELTYPDEVSALALKSLVTRVRYKATDLVDVWRCLEIAYAAGIEAREFTDGKLAECADIVRLLFADRRGRGMQGIAAELRLTDRAVDQRFTRLRALIARVLGRT